MPISMDYFVIDILKDILCILFVYLLHYLSCFFVFSCFGRWFSGNNLTCSNYSAIVFFICYFGRYFSGNNLACSCDYSEAQNHDYILEDLCVGEQFCWGGRRRMERGGNQNFSK